MKTLMKYAAAVALTGALALAAATPSEARNGRNAAAIGFGVGAVAGAAIAGSAYNGGYYGYYEPGYAYCAWLRLRLVRLYDGSYAYEPAPRYRYYRNWSGEHNTNNFSIDSAALTREAVVNQEAALRGGFFFTVRARRSSAPCRINAAACWSITAARFLRLTSASINCLSTAAVDRRSSHNAIGSSVILPKLRAKARVDCARGPSLPSILIGKPSTKPTAERSAASASSRSRHRRKVFPSDGFNAGRKLAVGIAPGNTDRLRSQVDAEQNAARWKMCSGLRERQDDGHA